MAFRQAAPRHLRRGRVVKPTAVAVGSVVDTQYGLRTVFGLEEGPDAVSTVPVLAVVLPPDDDRHVMLILDDGHWIWGHQVVSVVSPHEGLTEAGAAALRAAQTDLLHSLHLAGVYDPCSVAVIARVGFAVLAMHAACATPRPVTEEAEEGDQE